MKGKGKPRFGIMVAVTTTPMGKAYEKALKAKTAPKKVQKKKGK